MKCPYCTHIETKVIDSRLNQPRDITRRRRECLHCEGRFTTYERVEVVMPVVIKKDGRRESYTRDKTLGSFQAACQKRPVDPNQIDQMVSAIEKRIQSYGLKEIPSSAVGQMVMAELLKTDKVAYVRFASVYREFKDVEEFVSELKDFDAEAAEQSSLSFPFLTHEENHHEA